jgi:hypothetical protein
LGKSLKEELSEYSDPDIYLKFVVHQISVSDERKFEKTKKEVRDTVADETKEVRDTVADETKDVRDTVADETKDVRDTVAEDLGEQNYFRDQAKKLREKAAQIVEDDKSAKPESPRIKTESNLHSVNQATTEKGKEVFNMMGKKPLVTLLIIGAIVIGAILIYELVQYSNNQSNKEENFNASWNQSLDSLRSGNVSVTQYCNQNPHDQKLCDLYWDLKYM